MTDGLCKAFLRMRNIDVIPSVVDRLHIRELIIRYGYLEWSLTVRLIIVGDTKSLGRILGWRIEVVALHEVRLQPLPIPSFVSKLTPCIVVSIGTSIKLHSIHKGSAADDIANCYQESLVAKVWDGCAVYVVHGSKVKTARVTGKAR